MLLVAAAARVLRPDVTRTAWTAPAILAGLWLVVAAIAFTSSSGAAYIDVICGVGSILIALLTMDAGDPVGPDRV